MYVVFFLIFILWLVIHLTRRLFHDIAVSVFASSSIYIFLKHK